MAAIIEEGEIEKLRSEIDALRRELADKEAVLRYLEQKTEKKQTRYLTPEGPHIAKGIMNQKINFDELIVPSTSARTLVDDVKDAISHFGDKEFTVAHVEAALKKLGVIDIDADADAGRATRARISSILAKLYEAKELDRPFAGKGNVPHRYKNIEKGKNGQIELDL
ncbi:hypothetical protein [Methylobacter sp. YRD-M1]|uniref:hypothetical protein n=1 Tax=Methylobacter sp. YRD-M1 TaxID=2911520 RepID=UPI00227D4A91|nr:hypothetical protein [Methylobacter sp. YRD-M1]WAK01851.1 hypothetical protein LZ558_18860 [Methylobacter sp. YRD-M1]